MTNVIQFPSERGRGDFFAVDAKTWDAICRQGSINMPIAFLVMARGTAADNVRTSWSASAVERYTGISRRGAAKEAIQRLLVGKFITLERGGRHPLYLLAAAKKSEDLIWLPNALVDGAAGETAPIELIRQSASLPALQLFAELYHAQSLASVGGVHWRLLRQAYERHLVGQRGRYVVWGFKHKNEQVFHTRAPFMVGKPVAKAKDDDPNKALVFWDAFSI